MKYSVIVPVYNSFKYLKDIIDWFEVECEKRKDVELILIDDGSTDVPEYEINYKNVFFIKKDNGGVSSARNFGLKKAKGQYVSFLDSDDLFCNDYFDKMDSILNDESDIYLLSSKVTNFNKEKTHINSEGKLSGVDMLNLFFMKKINIHICSMLFSRDFLVDNGLFFNESYRYSEDILFIVESLSKARNCTSSSKLIYEYRIRSFTAITSPVSSRSLDHFKVFERIEILCNKIPEVDYSDFFLETCRLNVLKFSFLYGVDSKLVKIEVVENIVKNNRIKKFPWNKYGAKYLFSYFFIKLDFFLGSLLLMKLIPEKNNECS